MKFKFGMIYKRISFTGVILLSLVVFFRAWRDSSLLRGAADAEIAIQGIIATVFSACFSIVMFRVKHQMGKALAYECIADVFAASCTTAFALATHFGFIIPDFPQAVLRNMILTSGIIAQLHIFWTVLEAATNDEGVADGNH